MNSEVTVAITSVCSGSFALLGVVLSNRMAGNRERSALRSETALELADTERLVWEGDYVELRVQIERLNTRLTALGIDRASVDALARTTVACWHDFRAHVERSDGVPPGVRRDLLEARRMVQASVRADLLGEASRSERRRRRANALQRADAVLAEHRTAELAREEEALSVRCVTPMGLVRRR